MPQRFPYRVITLVIHCDGSFLYDPQLAAYGVIKFDANRNVVDGKAATYLCSCPFAIEAKAVLVASFLYDPQLAAYGVIKFDAIRDVVDGKVATYLCSSPFAIKAKAVLVAMNYASRLDSPVSVLSVCLSLVRFLKGEEAYFHWDAAPIIGLIKQILRSSPHIAIGFILRKENFKADCVV